jgi:hypothetical protein
MCHWECWLNSLVRKGERSRLVQLLLMLLLHKLLLQRWVVRHELLLLLPNPLA